ncbi:unnamed protein product [Prorocentrum cordatum]|uniref:Homoserine O-acetyltransferase n=1 Tax=Prorocentrum cordatum TaxID=2364126 RepID=A0ABN9QRT7_9DINO|nr:unnamed protein product [Polarella glacialis]
MARTGGGGGLPVLVTGACGHLGGHVVRRLAGRGQRVLATDRSEAPADPQAAWGPEAARLVEFVQADLTDGSAMQDLAARCGDAVHVGAIPGPTRHLPPGVDPACLQKSAIGLEDLPGLELLRLNLLGTGLLFEALAARRDGRRVVFSSSLFSMGYSHDPADFRPQYLPLDEDHPMQPLEHYGLSKAMGEEMARMLARVGAVPSNDDCRGPEAKRPRTSDARGVGPSFVCLRFSNIVKAERWDKLPWPAPENGVTPLLWAYCHESDVIDAHLLALDVPREALASSCESFLLVADDTRYDKPTSELISQQWDRPPPLRRALPDHSSIVSNDKAKQVLGFRPRSVRPLASSADAPQTGPGRGDRSWHTFRAPSGFVLSSGEILDDGFLAYQTYGELNTDGSNAVLHPTSFDAVHWELEYNIGPGRLLDTSKYFVIVINLLGNGVSMSPSTCEARATFPAKGTSMSDNVRLQALLLDKLGVGPLALIYGYSMGAMQALHWGVMYPDRVQRIAAVCGSARASDYNVVFLDSLRAALLADPHCVEGADGRLLLTGPCHRGLKTFGRIYAGWGVPMEFYRQELWRKSSRDGQPFASREDFVVRSYEGGFASANPLNLLAQLHTWATADVSKAHGMAAGCTLAEALGRVRARVYLMPCTTDAYFTVAETKVEASSLPNCRFWPLESDWGHRAGDPHRPGQEADAAALASRVAELLAEPTPC